MDFWSKPLDKFIFHLFSPVPWSVFHYLAQHHWQLAYSVVSVSFSAPTLTIPTLYLLGHKSVIVKYNKQSNNEHSYLCIFNSVTMMLLLNQVFMSEITFAH